VRVAGLFDVHGNLPALEAVLAEVPDDAAVVVGGDVALGPQPSETLERLRSLGERVRWLRGNCDRELDPAERGLAPADFLAWARERLTAEQIAFLHGLPERLELDVDGLGRVLFCHASPRNDEEIVLETTPDERLAPVFTGVEAQVVVCGHTHLQFDRRVGELRLVNAGSVGMPFEDEPGAYWSLLGPDVELRRTAFDDSELAELGYPGWRAGPAGRAAALALFEPNAVGA
jgi:putative phosphoesterase